MRGRTTVMTQKKLHRLIKKGLGQGEGAAYKPWRIPGFSTRGNYHRIHSWKTGRTHFFFSDTEADHFYVLEWCDDVVDIREQYPLFDTLLIAEIAKTLGVKAPVFPGTKLPYILTTDLMITIRSVGGQRRLMARTCKLEDDLRKERVLAKFDLEAAYYKFKGTDWGIYTKKGLHSQMIENIKDLRGTYNLGQTKTRTAEQLQQLIPFLLAELATPHDSTRQMLAVLDRRHECEGGTFLRILKHLIARKRLSLRDIKQRIDYRQPVERLIVTPTLTNQLETAQ